jgi:hypothetical protein
MRDPFLKATPEPELVTLPAAKFLVFEGEGAPESAAFQTAVGALYGLAYTLKFENRKAGGADFKVSPLEALWWAKGPKSAFDFQKTPRSRWKWKAMIRLPDAITRAQVEAARKVLIAKRGDAGASSVTFERIKEGRAVQVLHVGPYATEPASIEKMQALMQSSHLTPRGYHHEIYLGDPRRAKPEKLKTILRQAVSAHHHA